MEANKSTQCYNPEDRQWRLISDFPHEGYAAAVAVAAAAAAASAALICYHFLYFLGVISYSVQVYSSSVIEFYLF
jgi:hypothetical protein